MRFLGISFTFNSKRKILKDILKKERMLEDKIDNIRNMLEKQNIIAMYKERGFSLPWDVDWSLPPDIIRIKLKDIKWKSWIDGNVYSLDETFPYKYMKSGDKKIYLDYMEKGKNLKTAQEWWSIERFDDLIQKVKKEDYSPQNGIIVIDKNNCLLDGQHRCCILYSMHGGDYEILVAVKD